MAGRFSAGPRIGRPDSIRQSLSPPCHFASDCLIMETQPPLATPPLQAPPSRPVPQKGLGTGAKVGIGCGALVLLAILGFIVVGVMFGGKLKKFAEDAKMNPTKATATMMVTASAGTMEIIAEDNVNKRYTVKDKKTGALTTIYWSEKKKGPEVIQGDFSMIPVDSATTAPESGSVPTPGTEVK